MSLNYFQKQTTCHIQSNRASRDQLKFNKFTKHSFDRRYTQEMRLIIDALVRVAVERDPSRINDGLWKRNRRKTRRQKKEGPRVTRREAQEGGRDQAVPRPLGFPRLRPSLPILLKSYSFGLAGQINRHKAMRTDKSNFRMSCRLTPEQVRNWNLQRELETVTFPRSTEREFRSSPTYPLLEPLLPSRPARDLSPARKPRGGS